MLVASPYIGRPMSTCSPVHFSLARSSPVLCSSVQSLTCSLLTRSLLTHPLTCSLLTCSPAQAGFLHYSRHSLTLGTLLPCLLCLEVLFTDICMATILTCHKSLLKCHFLDKPCRDHSSKLYVCICFLGLL